MKHACNYGETFPSGLFQKTSWNQALFIIYLALTLSWKVRATTALCVVLVGWQSLKPTISPARFMPGFFTHSAMRSCFFDFSDHFILGGKVTFFRWGAAVRTLFTSSSSSPSIRATLAPVFCVECIFIGWTGFFSSTIVASWLFEHAALKKLLIVWWNRFSFEATCFFHVSLLSFESRMGQYMPLQSHWSSAIADVREWDMQISRDAKKWPASFDFLFSKMTLMRCRLAHSSTESRTTKREMFLAWPILYKLIFYLKRHDLVFSICAMQPLVQRHDPNALGPHLVLAQLLYQQEHFVVAQRQPHASIHSSIGQLEIALQKAGGLQVFQ